MFCNQNKILLLVVRYQLDSLFCQCLLCELELFLAPSHFGLTQLLNIGWLRPNYNIMIVYTLYLQVQHMPGLVLCPAAAAVRTPVIGSRIGWTITVQSGKIL